MSFLDGLKLEATISINNTGCSDMFSREQIN